MRADVNGTAMLFLIAMKKIINILLILICVVVFAKGFLNGLIHNYISSKEKDKYVSVPQYRFATKTLERDILKEVRATSDDIYPYDVCFAESPVSLWDESGTEVVDTMNLFLVSHHEGMSYYRDSIFPYVVKGVVQSGLRMFFFYDSISVNRLLKPINKVWYARKKDTRDGYILIVGGMESEIGFYLNESNRLRAIPRQILESMANYPEASKIEYFIENDEFESQSGLNNYNVDTTNTDIGPYPLFPTKNNIWDSQLSKEELDKFILYNVYFPEEEIIDVNSMPNRVVVFITIERDGHISKTELLRSREDYWDKEALRVVSLFPLYMPAHMKGQAIRRKISVSFDFRKIYEEREMIKSKSSRQTTQAD